MYSKSITEVKELLRTTGKGLGQEEAAERLRVNGKNVIQEGKTTPAILRFLGQFKNIIIIVLLFSMALSIFIAITENNQREFIDAAFIGLIVLINVSVGYLQETKAEKSIAALKKSIQPYAKVFREGTTIRIRTDELVIGDVVLIEAGDIIPADVRLIESASLKIEESALTGESVPVEKITDALPDGKLALGDQKCMAFLSGIVAYGRGKGIVVATGMQTQLGLIAENLSKQERPVTPLTKKLVRTNTLITIIVALVALFVFISRALTGDPITHSIMVTIAIAVCAIPEGLPTCITITMALGVQRMSQRKAIIRNLPAVETLGSTEIICSDKTGTLTLNQMTVQKFFIKTNESLDECVYEVDKLDIQAIDRLRGNINFQSLIECMILCNDTQTKYENNSLTTIGDPTETALVHCAYLFDYTKDYTDAKLPRVDEIPFESERKLMTTVHQRESDFVMYTKGSLEKIFERCNRIWDNGFVRDITDFDKTEITKRAQQFALSALRVLGYACKYMNELDHKMQLADEGDLIWIGFTGMIDPPREEVFESIKVCKAAGITPIMISGDHRDTAFAIAKTIGIAEREDQVITGMELESMNDEILSTSIDKYRVYARMNPEHKVRIVRIFKAKGKIVAMTGDGVNDAPSIKAADIGIGMGISGTDVTKGAADVILTDDNFATIVTAVEEGRRTYSNILKIMVYLLGTSLAELVLLTAIIALFRLPFFNPLLILWINVITDTLPALALGTVASSKDIMRRKPNPAGGSLFRGHTGMSIIVYSMFQVLLCLSVYLIGMFGLGYSDVACITMAYLVLCIIEAIHCFNIYSDKESIFRVNPFKNKLLNYASLISLFLIVFSIAIPLTGLQGALGITGLNGIQWLLGIVLGLLIVPLSELYKAVTRKK